MGTIHKNQTVAQPCCTTNVIRLMSDDARNKTKRTINILLLVSGIVSIVAVIFVFLVKSAGTIAVATGQVEPTVPPPLPLLDTNPVVSSHMTESHGTYN